MCFFWDPREADIVIAQGSEAGGHVRDLVSPLVLVPQVAQAVSVPVIASGGFASGASLVAALALGAQGIHCGTAFLAARESFAHDYHKERLVAERTEDTVYTDIFGINWPLHLLVRVIANSAVNDGGRISLDHRPHENAKEIIGENEDQPIYLWSTDSPLRSTTGDIESMALFGDQVVGEIDRVEGVAEVISRMVQETTSTLRGLGRPPPDRRETAAMLPKQSGRGAELVILDGLEHSILREMPEWAATAVQDLFARHA